MSRHYLVLRGPLEGETVRLNNCYQFVHGQAVIDMHDDKFEGLALYLRKCYQVQEVSRGEFEAYGRAVGGTVSEMVGGLRSAGQTSSEGGADPRTGDVEANGRGAGLPVEVGIHDGSELEEEEVDDHGETEDCSEPDEDEIDDGDDVWQAEEDE